MTVRPKTVALVVLAVTVVAYLVFCYVQGESGARHRASSALSAGLGMQVKSGALCNAGHCEPALMVSGYLDEGFVTRLAATADNTGACVRTTLPCWSGNTGTRAR